MRNGKVTKDQRLISEAVRSRRPARVVCSPPTPNWPAVTVTVRQRNLKCYKHKPTHPGTPLNTVNVMVNSPGHVGVSFAEKRHGLCESDVCQFQTSKKGPNASSDLAKTPVRPPFSIGTHERTTKLTKWGGGSRGHETASGIGRACSWVGAHNELRGVLRGVSARKRG